MIGFTRGTSPAAVSGGRVAELLSSRTLQVAAIAISFAWIAFAHRQADGLWFQGDAPRHAANGFLIWDAIRMHPRDPLAFALSYYARYPVIMPVAYPPLFYVFEGLVFAVFGPSPQNAKLLVGAFGVVGGIYTMAFARRWIAPAAGWAGAFLAFLPAIVLWSNTIMLNVPAMALGLAALFHFGRWLDEARPVELLLAAVFAVAAVLTYYLALWVVPVCVAWTMLRRKTAPSRRRLFWMSVAVLAALVPLAVSLLWMPTHTVRQLPTVSLLTRSTTWTYYWAAFPALLGVPVLVVGLFGAAAGLIAQRRAVVALRVVTWIVLVVVMFSILPAKDPRYILVIAPAFVLAAALGLSTLVDRIRWIDPRWLAAPLAVGFVGGAWYAAQVRVPQISGFRDAAVYLAREGPTDAVLYDGAHEGVFGFFMRALDPAFQRRMVRSDKLLFQYGPGTTFEWVRSSTVTSTDDVMRALRTQAGCRWVAIEVGPNPPSTPERRLLREVVRRPDFSLVRSFPIAGAGERRIDLYRLSGDVPTVTAVDLSFPSYSTRTFSGVAPIVR